MKPYLKTIEEAGLGRSWVCGFNGCSRPASYIFSKFETKKDQTYRHDRGACDVCARVLAASSIGESEDEKASRV